MPDREKIIEQLEKMRDYHRSIGNNITADISGDALELLKEQEAMNVDAFVQWCIDSHIMGDATVRGIKYWVEKYKETNKGWRSE